MLRQWVPTVNSGTGLEATSQVPPHERNRSASLRQLELLRGRKRAIASTAPRLLNPSLARLGGLLIRLGRESVISGFSQQELVPRAAPHAREYMATLFDNIQACDPPVTMSQDDVTGGGVTLQQCLVVEPADKRLRHYKMLHYAVPQNSALQMGYYVIGGDRAAGGALFGGATFGIGLPTDADAANVEALVRLIRNFAFAPAVQHVVDLLRGAGGARRGGFADV